ncbi:MAG: glycerol-3-phosphate dehydrogenase/oxidase [Rubrobacter sp.]|nr:glycerol-3-phosphate dehydrogenase/oxidase [Rubrobacter sp.]
MEGYRERALEELGRGVFDVLVIGGGIVGSRAAFDAARIGLRVALVDAGDFGGATSGASARLVHGGLRYLGTGGSRLVRAALRERDVFTSRIAPHLVRPLPFALSVAGGLRQRSRFAAGLLVYAALDGFRGPLPRFVTPEEAALLVPQLLVENLSSHALFHEAGTNDSRLTLATVTAAARSGAVVANYLRAVALDLRPGGTSRVSLQGIGGEVNVRCSAVVNATGPWVDRIRGMEDPGCGPIARLSKGVHVVLRPDEKWRAAVAVSLEGGRHLYAVPCEGTILLGTTDEEYDGDPSGVAAQPEDVSYLLDSAGQFLCPELLRDERVISAFAGLRVLPRGEETVLHASRDHLLRLGTGGMVSVAGGKLTTHRRIALDALRHLPDTVRPRRLSLSDVPLPGAAPAGVYDLHARLDGGTLDHLLHLYGGETGRLLEYSEEDSDALQQIAPGAPDLWAQVYHAVRAEWALTAEDVIYRRTTLGLRGIDTSEVRQTISALLGSRVRAENSPPGLKGHSLRKIEGPAPKCLDGVRVFDGNGSLSLE